MTSHPLLRVRDLAVEFHTAEGTVRAVKGVDFTVERGRTLGIVGESGSGKSVTSLAVMGLHRGATVTGSARLDGTELIGTPDERLRTLRGRRMAMVFQDALTALHPYFTVGDQIAEGIRAHFPVTRSEARDRALRLVEEVGIADAGARLDAYPHQLSGGMRQRVMIAIALAAEPEILVADEPTTALDVTVQAQILEVLDRLRASRGMAVLLITHDLGIVAGRADRVAVMYAGQIVEEASTASLFANPSHPYTQGLFASVPRITGPVGRLTPIGGSVPPPTAWPSGCRFRPRCPKAFDKSELEPPLLPVGPGHRMRCWLAEPDRPA